MAAAAVTRGVYLVGCKRTPFGAFGGKLKDVTPTSLQEVAAKGALKAANLRPEQIDSVIVGCVIQNASKDGCYIARHVLLRCGIPDHVPALTVNRLCGSGFQSIVNGAQEISLGISNIVLTGGSDSMSLAPYSVRNIRFGTKLGENPNLEDSLWVSLTDSHIKTPMGGTAENLADKYKLTREECDAIALRSQQRWAEAHKAGRFAAEMEPVVVASKKGDVIVDVDEHPRPNTTMEQLAKLPAVFKKGGVVTAGNSSGICDGAGAVILASEDAVKKNNLTPLARLVAYSYVGCDPNIMGIGPVPAIRKVLDKSGVALNDVDLIEVNEAFAAQCLSVERELGLNPEKVNVDGGAIALGHPLAASGSRITSHLVHELRRQNGKYAIGSACIGGGQGIAVLLENVHLKDVTELYAVDSVKLTMLDLQF